MKRTAKPVFFIVALLILALAYLAIFGVYTQYGDRRDTIIRGASDIRFGIDIRGGVDVTFGPKDETMDATTEQIDAIKEVIAQRLVMNNITDYELYTDVANDRVIVRYPWSSSETSFDPAEAVKELGQTAQLAFHYGGSTTGTDEDGNTVNQPAGDLIFTGDLVDKAESMMIQNEQGQTEPIVNLTLKSEGAALFATATKTQLANSGTISIWLDDQMISNATVKAEITDGVATISGGFETLSDATYLANLINSGALPFEIEDKSVSTIAPLLGERSLEAMVMAGLIAFALVAVFMILYYRLPGFIASIGLVGQIAGMLACVSGFFPVFSSFTLTLPGIAGIILSIGMGVDANVITAERVREELRRGRTIDGAVQRGSHDSFSAILDGNVTVLIVAAVLMGVFGPSSGLFGIILSPILRWFPVATTGAVYSFGYTLFVGVVFNFVIGVWASRMMMQSATRFKCLRKPWLFGGERA